MKILRLRLTNLNSLRGSNEVDFTQPPLAHAGLFAITGPTGAGKSTLLDAITLALYGRVARYGSMPSPDAVMSRHTGECSAEVEFACAAGEFRSVWQLQRARKKADGKIQQAKRRVIALPAETIIAESIKETDATILELTGLDYDRFLRSVLLAQGDFATFLKAGAKERTDLLQQVTGTVVYEDISRAAFRRAADAEQALATLRREQDAVTLLDPEQRRQHEAHLATQLERLRQLQELAPALTRRIDEARRWLDVERATRQLQADQAAHDQACQDDAPNLARLTQHEKAAPFIADLTTLDHFARDDEKDVTARRELDANAPQRLQTVQTAQTAAQEAHDTLTRETEQMTGLRVLWTEVIELDRGLATAREALRQVETQHAEAGTRLTAASTAQAAAAAALQHTTAEHLTASGWLNQHPLDATLTAQLPEIQAAHARWQAAEEAGVGAEKKLELGQAELKRVEIAVGRIEEILAPLRTALAKANTAVTTAVAAVEVAGEQQPLSELETRRDRTRDRRQALDKLAGEAAHLRKQTAELATVRRNADVTTELLRQGAAAITQLTQNQDAAAALLQAHRVTLSFAEKVQSLESHRTTLRDNEPCPLCGGVHHPYVSTSDTPARSVAAVRGQVAAAEAACLETRQQLGAAENLRASHLGTEKRHAADDAKLTAEITRLTTDWNSAAEPHGLEGQWQDEARLTAEIATARTEESRRDTQLLAVRTAENLLTAARREAQNALTNFVEQDTEGQKQSTLFKHLREQWPSLEDALAEQRRRAVAARDALAQLTSAYVPSEPGAAPTAGLLATLNERATTYTRHQQAVSDLFAKVEKLRATFDGCAQQFEQAQASVEAAARKVAAAGQEVERQDRQRQEKFGQRVVAEAQRIADTALQNARSAADSKRKESEACRQKQESAAKEQARLTEAIAARSAPRAQIAARLQAGAVAAGFGDGSAIRSALLDPTAVTVLGARRAHLDDRRTVLKTQAEGLATQRRQLPPAAAADAGNLSHLAAEKAAGETELTAVHAAVADSRAILKHDDGLRGRHALVAEQIQAADREFVRWHRLRVLIGSADGSLFARFAQGLTLEHLTVLANRHLRQLNPRYTIRRATDGAADDLELEIVDHYQADVTRPMRSLSGGESFLVSLALALGLSQLASGRTSIESLFIDEGFGSLDAETLEVAMSALENLQAGGKVIGVISHVPAMQERITVQINVTKETGGCSRIALRS